MNIIVVVFVFFKSWMKDIKKNVLSFILCLLGLLFSIYLYNIYNSVREQNLMVISKHYGNAEWKSKYYFYCGMPYYDELGFDPELPCLVVEDSLVNYTNTDTNSSRDSLLKWCGKFPFLQENLQKNSDIGMDYGVSHVIRWDYQDDYWFLPHKKAVYSKDTPIFYQTKYEEEVITKDISSDRIYFKQESKECYNLIKDKWFGKNRWYGDMSCYEFFNGNSKYKNPHTTRNTIEVGQYYDAHWYSAYDISKLVIKYSLSVGNTSYESLMASSVEEINVSFIDIVHADNIYPEPDKRFSNYIVYTDSTKIDEIGTHGLKFYLEFPKNASVQQGRNYVLSAVITLFFTLLVSILYELLKKKYYSRKRRLNICKQLCLQDKPKLAIRLYNPLLFNDSFIATCLLLPFLMINPLELSRWQLLIFFFIILSSISLLFTTFWSISKIVKLNDVFFVYISKLRIGLKIVLALFIFMLFLNIASSYTGKRWLVIFVLSLTAFVMYICFRIYCLLSLDLNGINYYYKPKLKKSKLLKCAKVFLVISLLLLIAFEIQVFTIYLQIPAWAMDFGEWDNTVTRIELCLGIIIIISYLFIKLLNYRRKP